MNLDNPRAVWALAIFSITVLWGLGNLAVGYSSRVLDANAMIYTCSLFVSAAWVLLLYAGHGPLSKETLRSLDTWAYGIVLIVSFLLSFAIFSLVTAAEGALLQRASIVASLLASWFFLSRSTGKLQLLGSLVVVGGILWVCSGLPDENKATIYGLVFLFSFLQAARVFIAEFHKPHKVAAQHTADPKARCRVVGYVMFVVAMLFLALSLVGALIYEQTGQLILKGMPTLNDFTHSESILFGLLVGAVIIAPIRFIEFASSHTIKTENYLALATIAPFSTLFWEWATQPITGLSLKEFTQQDMLAGLVITFGGLLVAFGAIRSSKKQHDYEKHLCYQAQNIALVEDCREIVANTLEHFNADVKKSAEALGVPQKVVTAFLEDSEKVVAFKNFPDVARAYRKHVAMADSLTGLANRSAFMTALRSAAYEVEVYSVIYIDLDKFKPVNDTYGHEAGDKVLQGVAERLTEVAPKNTVITRMGGDEYCMLLLGMSKEDTEKLVPKIQQAIAQPFKFEGIDDEISVSASVGIASYPEDSDNPDELLAIADKGMFGVKHARE